MPPQRPCSLCQQPLDPKKRYSINGIGVCRACHGSFLQRREAAFLVDWVVWYLLLGYLLAVPVAEPFSEPVLFVEFFVWLTFALKDCFHGVSPGKWLFGLQVMDMETRQPASFWQAIKRNLWLSIPPLLLLNIIPALGGARHGRHWGDRWAETLVVLQRQAHCLPFCGNQQLCRTCGYNLTGNISGICPECGTPIGRQARP
jgi:uncharacterized RDD family membrane protein YckC